MIEVTIKPYYAISAQEQERYVVISYVCPLCNTKTEWVYPKRPPVINLKYLTCVGGYRTHGCLKQVLRVQLNAD